MSGGREVQRATLAPRGAELGEGRSEMDGGILHGYGAYRRIFSILFIL